MARIFAVKNRIRTLAALVLIVMCATIAAQGTGAWFVDYAPWVDTKYRVGIIDYDIYVNGGLLQVETQREEQEFIYDLAFPITGGVKIDDVEPYEISAEMDFNQGVTMGKFNVINRGDFPTYVSCKFTSFGALADKGILYMMVPTDAVVDEDAFTISHGGISYSYKDYIKSEITHGYTTPAGMTGLNVRFDPTLTSSYAIEKGLVLDYNVAHTDVMTSPLLMRVFPRDVDALPDPVKRPGDESTYQNKFTFYIMFWAEFDEWQQHSTTVSAFGNDIRATGDGARMIITVTPPDE